MLISIRDFVITGHFGPVRIGMRKSEVIQLLGPPDDAAEFSAGNSGLIYGGYEFFFCDDELVAMQNDWVDFGRRETVYFQNDQFEVDPWILSGQHGTHLDAILERCRVEGIDCEIVEYFGRSAIRSSSGVVIDFREPEEDGTLIAVRFFPRH